MHTDEWDNIYKQLKDELGRKPTTREVQDRLYQKHFG